MLTRVILLLTDSNIVYILGSFAFAIAFLWILPLLAMLIVVKPNDYP